MKRYGSLEERIEYSNATQFRKSFLGIVDELQHNNYLRYVVTKHGEPRAVVMSFVAYDLMKRAVEEVIALDDRRSPAEAARAAFEQLNASSRQSTGSMVADLTQGDALSPTEVLERLNALVEEVNDLRQRVGQGVPVASSALKRA